MWTALLIPLIAGSLTVVAQGLDASDARGTKPAPAPVQRPRVPELTLPPSVGLPQQATFVTPAVGFGADFACPSTLLPDASGMTENQPLLPDAPCIARVLRTDDGGRTWNVVGDDLAIPVDRLDRRLNGSRVTFAKERLGWLHGYGRDALVTRDGGLSWSEAGLYSAIEIKIAGEAAWALVSRCAYCRLELAHQTLGDGVWRDARLPTELAGYDADLAAIDSDSAAVGTWHYGEGPGFAATDDGGRTWRVGPPPCRGWYSVLAPIDEVRIGALCQGEPAGCQSVTTEVSVSSDAGRSWTVRSEAHAGVPELDHGYFSFVALDESTFLMGGGCHIDGLAIRSTDGGATWSRILPETFCHGFSIDAVDAQHAWMRNDGALYRTQDGGASWERVAANPDADHC